VLLLVLLATEHLVEEAELGDAGDSEEAEDQHEEVEESHSEYLVEFSAPVSCWRAEYRCRGGMELCSIQGCSLQLDGVAFWAPRGCKEVKFAQSTQTLCGEKVQMSAQAQLQLHSPHTISLHNTHSRKSSALQTHAGFLLIIK